MAQPGFRNVTALTRPRSLAVIGASRRPNRGRRVLENLQRFGYAGDLLVVNPNYPDVLGVPAVPSIADLLGDTDLLMIALGADAALRAAAEAGVRGVRGLVLIGSGFGEGNVGTERSVALRQILDQHGMVACGPNCYGLLDTRSGTAAYSGRIVDPFKPGNIALIMQSGALTHAVTDSALGRGLGLSALVTTGNEVSATVSDYLAWYAADEGTEVIGVFLEGLRDPKAFAQACRAAREVGKPVIVLSSGRSAIGRSAAMAHTGAIAGGPGALDGFLAAAGAIRVDDIDDFRETLLLCSRVRSPRRAGGGLATVSISGGASGLTADLSETLGVRLPAFGKQTAAALRAALPEFAAVNNPLDATGSAVENPQVLTDALTLAAGDGQVEIVAFALNVARSDEPQLEFYRNQARQVAEVAAGAETPFAAIAVASGAVDEELVKILDAAGVPLLVGLRPALRAIGAWLAQPGRTPSQARTVPVREAWPFAAGVVPGYDAMALLRASGVPVPPFGRGTTPEEIAAVTASLPWPVVLKIESPDLAHKSDAGGVALRVGSPAEALDAARQMAERVAARAPQARQEGFLAQAMVTGDTLEVLVGVIRDPQVGLVVSVAPGGVLADLMGPAPSRPVPASRADIEALIDASPLARLLAGYRGAPRLDRAALVDAVLAISDLAASLPGLAAVEVNPLLVRPEGEGVAAVDALFTRC